MKELVTLNEKEQRRLMVLNRVERGQMVGREASEVLGLSLRQVRRLIAVYRQEGAQALAHGNRGIRPPHALDDALKRKVLELAQSTYAGFNNQHLTELLEEREGITLSRSSVRRILLEKGIKSPRRRRPSKHRSRRPRYSKEGMLLQIDGSDHDWLEGRGPRLTLIGAIDDATGKVPYALFREEEDAQGYFLLLKGIVDRCGIPMALYHDRHGIFEKSKDQTESLEEQLRGEKKLTQFGRLMEELEISSISCYSPQAKGRIERLWGTFQDRLVSELRLKGIKTIKEANEALREHLTRHNQKFKVKAIEEEIAYRQAKEGFLGEEVFCFKYRRRVGLDNVVRFGEERIQIMPGNGRLSYAKAKVEVQERMDGSVGIYYQGKCLATKEAPLEAPVLRVRGGPYIRSSEVDSNGINLLAMPEDNTSKPKPAHITKPRLNHPWRMAIKTYMQAKEEGDKFSEHLG